jgi:hypothetical protein
MMRTSTTQPASRFPAACTAWRLIGLATLVLGPAACTEMADPVAGEQALTERRALDAPHYIGADPNFQRGSKGGRGP